MNGSPGPTNIAIPLHVYQFHFHTRIASMPQAALPKPFLPDFPPICPLPPPFSVRTEQQATYSTRFRCCRCRCRCTRYFNLLPMLQSHLRRECNLLPLRRGGHVLLEWWWRSGRSSFVAVCVLLADARSNVLAYRLHVLLSERL